jgi:O-antigen ligase
VLLALIPLAVLVCLPFLSTFQLAKALVVGPLLAMLLLRTGAQGSGRPAGLGPLGPAFLFYLALSLPALLRAASPAAAAWEIWFDLLFLGAAIAGARLGGPDPAKRLLAAITTGGGAVLAVVVLDAAGVRVGTAGSMASAGTMGNPSFAAAVAALCVPALAARLIDGRRAPEHLVLAGLAAGVLWTLYRLESLSGWIAAGAGIAACLAFRLAARGRRRAAVLIAATLVLGAALALSVSAVRQRWEGRAFLARAGLGAASTAPFVGSGIGGFPQAYLDAQGGLIEADPSTADLWTRALHAHNELVHTLVERGGLGLVGMLVVWGVVAAALWRRLRHATDVDDAPEDGSSSSSIAALAGVGGILVAWFVLALAEFPGHLVPTQLILGLAAGIACRRNAADAAASAPLPVARRIATCGAAIVLALVPAWLALSDALHVSGDPAAALRVNPWNGEAAFASGLAEQLGGAPTGCSRLERATATAPSPAVALALGNCYQRRGMIPQAVKAYRRAVRWSPRNAAAHGNLAMALLDAGDDEAARRHAARARSLRPGDPAIVALYRRVTDTPRGERPE